MALCEQEVIVCECPLLVLPCEQKVCFMNMGSSVSLWTWYDHSEHRLVMVWTWHDHFVKIRSWRLWIGDDSFVNTGPHIYECKVITLWTHCLHCVWTWCHHSVILVSSLCEHVFIFEHGVMTLWTGGSSFVNGGQLVIPLWAQSLPWRHRPW